MIWGGSIWKRTVPIDRACEVHGTGNGEEAGNGTHEQGVIFEPQQQVDECIQQSEDNKRANSLCTACEDPASVGGKQSDGGSPGDEEAKIETDALGQRKQQQVKDDLCDAYENVLRGMDAFARGDLEYEVERKSRPRKRRTYLSERVTD